MASMSRDEAKNYINSNPHLYLKQDNSGKGYVCPVCGSGTGHNGTGMTTKDGLHFTCWADSCFKNSDMIEIIGRVEGIDDYPRRLEKACEIYGIDIAQDAKTANKAQKPHAPQKQAETAKQTETAADYSDFFLHAHSRLDDTGYHRGISRATLDKFQVGFDPQWKHPDRPNMQTSSRAIIPLSKSHYLARDTRDNLTDAQKPYAKIRVGKNAPFFNERVLWTLGGPVIVVEGEFDAMSIEDVGGEAVALGSTSGVSKFLETCKKRRPRRTIAICMDNDGPGKNAAAKLLDGLQALNIPCFIADISGGKKDANELLMADREALRQNVAIALKKEIAGDFAIFAVDSFWESTAQKRQGIKTGFADLDNMLDGGLYPGLYIVGAISSFGKTTFALQIADYVAAHGQDALVFSLEMSRHELMAKSVSRLSYMASMRDYENPGYALTTRQLLNRGSLEFTAGQNDFIDGVFSTFKRDVAGHVAIVEGMGNVGTDVIREKIQKYVWAGLRPVVFVDYLQIIAPYSDKATDKQNMDRAVVELKRISRDFNIPILAISSFNRASYREDAGMEAFKESGAIEYSSDVLLALQFKKIAEIDNEARRKKEYNEIMDENNKKAAEGKAQEIVVKVLKNRNGWRGDVSLAFYPKYNFFENKRGWVEV